MKIDFTKVKVGDRVRSLIMGWGNVVQIVESRDYPFEVLFDHGGILRTYNSDGKYRSYDLYPEIVEHTPVKTKRSINMDIGVNIYPFPFNQFMSYGDRSFVIYKSVTMASDAADPDRLIATVTGRLVLEWEE